MRLDQLTRTSTGEIPADVRSEVGALRRVLVHRPGSELDRLQPGNAAALLFDDVPRPERARAEHDALVATLRGDGVEVTYLEDLLSAGLRDPADRATTIVRAVAGAAGPGREALIERLSRLSPAELAGALIAGDGDGLDPLPNLMFVRDSSAWLGGELVLGALTNPVRWREAELLERAYEGDVAFAGACGTDRALRLPELEGGDLFCLSERAALVGVGSRTAASAVEALSERLFAADFERVLVVEIPAERASIHLDCLITFVDQDLALVDRRLIDRPAIEMLPPGGRTISRIHLNLAAGLAAVLDLDALRTVEIADPGEQWTLAANVLALRPGRVVAYRHNERTNAALAAAGVEVLDVPGEELARGHGGPRCLTCPLNRDAVIAA
jgi:arginine deiminase